MTHVPVRRRGCWRGLTPFPGLMPAVYIFSIYLAIDMWSQYVYSRTTSGRAPANTAVSPVLTLPPFATRARASPCPPCAAHGHQSGAFFPKFTKGEQGEMPKLKDRGSGGLPADE